MSADPDGPEVRSPRCPVCGYDLHGLPADHRCPECGFAYTEEAIRSLAVDEAERRAAACRFAVEVCAWAVAIVIALALSACLFEHFPQRGYLRQRSGMLLVVLVVVAGIWRVLLTISMEELWRIPLYLAASGAIALLAIQLGGAFNDLVLVVAACVAVAAVVRHRPVYPHRDCYFTNEMRADISRWSKSVVLSIGTVAVVLLLRAAT